MEKREAERQTKRSGKGYGLQQGIVYRGGEVRGVVIYHMSSFYGLVRDDLGITRYDRSSRGNAVRSRNYFLNLVFQHFNKLRIHVPTDIKLES